MQLPESTGATSATRFRIGDFCINSATDEVIHGESSTKLEPRAMRVLVHLARRADEVVSVDELLNAVWGDVVVTPDSVYGAITLLRRVFADDSKAPRYIRNVPRRGYRLIASISSWESVAPGEQSETETAAAAPLQRMPGSAPRGRRRIAWWTAAGIVLGAALAILVIGPLRTGQLLTGSPSAASQSPDIASIAVLPFVDMSERRDQEYFSDGLSEQLIDLLARNPQLRVSARTSSFYFKNKPQDIVSIARQLHVANVLEGSIRKSGSTLRVTVQLIRADNGFHLWSQAYDRQLTDVLKMQDDIAAAVVGALLPKLVAAASHAPRDTVVGEAYEQWLLAKYIISSHPQDGGLQRAMAALEAAIQRDPSFAPAYATLGFMKCMIAVDSGQDNPIAGSRQVLTKALELSPGLPDAYGARSQCRLFSLDIPGALEDAQRAVAGAPGDARWRVALAYGLASNGKFAEAVAAAQVGTELDPLHTYAWASLGQFLIMTGDLRGAREALRRALDINPGESEAQFALGTVELLDGKAEQALTIFAGSHSKIYRKTGVALAQYSLGHEREASDSLADLIANAADTSPYQIAEVYAWRGERDEALKWLERAQQRGDPGVSYVKFDPYILRLQSDPRYQRLMRILNLSP